MLDINRGNLNKISADTMWVDDNKQLPFVSFLQHWQQSVASSDAVTSNSESASHVRGEDRD